MSAAVSFTLRMTPDLKDALEAQAQREKRSTSAVLQRAAEDYLRRQQAFDAMLDRLEAEADQGVFISDEAMTAWFDSLDDNPDAPPPQPDIVMTRR